MKWVVERDVIVEVLHDLVTIAEKSAIIPITSNVKMTIYGNSISMVTTDTKLQIKAMVSLASDQDVEQAIVTTVSARKLLDSCRAAEDKEIIFDLSENKLSLTFKKGKFTLLTHQAIDFPEIQEPKEAVNTLSLPQKVWVDMISSTIYAAAENHHKETLCGVLLEVEKSTVRMVATNGHRMAIVETENEQATQSRFKQAILPRKSLQEMQRLIADSDEMLSLSFQGDSHVSFQLEKNHISFTSNLIEGEYPDYRQAISNEEVAILRVNKEEFSKGIANAVIIQKSPPRTVEIIIDKQEVILSSGNYEGEESRIMLDASFDGEEKMEMSFNEEYLQSALRSLTSDTVAINIGTSHSSILIREQSDNIVRTSLVMPLNA